MGRFASSYTARREHLLHMLTRRSRYVFFTKIVLGVLIVILLGIMVILPLLEEDARIVLSSKEEGEELQPVMLNPKFQGVDEKNQPFMVTASRAYHKDADTVELQNIQADLTMNDKTWLAVSAKEGTLKLDAENLLLSGNVQMFHDGGYELSTERVRIDTATGNASGEAPLQGQGLLGFFKAEQFSILDKGDRMVFTGHVTLIIQPDA